MQQDATNVRSCRILLPSAENKRTIVLAGGSCCIGQPGHFSVVAFCCIQLGLCEMYVEVRVLITSRCHSFVSEIHFCKFKKEGKICIY